MCAMHNKNKRAENKKERNKRKKTQKSWKNFLLFSFLFPISKSAECFYPFDTVGINVKRMKRQKEVEECDFMGKKNENLVLWRSRVGLLLLVSLNKGLNGLKVCVICTLRNGDTVEIVSKLRMFFGVQF